MINLVDSFRNTIQKWKNIIAIDHKKTMFPDDSSSEDATREDQEMVRSRMTLDFYTTKFIQLQVKYTADIRPRFLLVREILASVWLQRNEYGFETATYMLAPPTAGLLL